MTPNPNEDPMNTNTAVKVGDRRTFPHGYSLPHLSIHVPAGAFGTVVYADDALVSVELDEQVENLHDSEWQNCIDFSIGDDPDCYENSTDDASGYHVEAVASYGCPICHGDVTFISSTPAREQAGLVDEMTCDACDWTWTR